jgi:hypothetical protein
MYGLLYSSCNRQSVPRKAADSSEALAKYRKVYPTAMAALEQVLKEQIDAASPNCRECLAFCHLALEQLDGRRCSARDRYTVRKSLPFVNRMPVSLK